jgi:hypothetical protein
VPAVKARDQSAPESGPEKEKGQQSN